MPLSLALPCHAASDAVELVLRLRGQLLVKDAPVLEVDRAERALQLQGQALRRRVGCVASRRRPSTSTRSSIAAQTAVPWVEATTRFGGMSFAGTGLQRGDLADEGLHVHAMALSVAAYDGGQHRPLRVSIPGAPGASRGTSTSTDTRDAGRGDSSCARACPEAPLLGRRASVAAAGTSTSTSTSSLRCRRQAGAVCAAHGEARRLRCSGLVLLLLIEVLGRLQDLRLRRQDPLLMVRLVHERRLVDHDLLVHLLQRVAHGLREGDARRVLMVAAGGFEAADHLPHL